MQLLGVAAIPVLAKRYVLDGGDWYADVAAWVGSAVKALPGLDK